MGPVNRRCSSRGAFAQHGSQVPAVPPQGVKCRTRCMQSTNPQSISLVLFVLLCPMHLQMEHLLVRLSLRALVNLALRALVKLTFPARTMYSQRRTMARGLGLKIADSVDHLDHNPREALH